MKKVLILFAHPKFERSTSNAVLVNEIKNLDSVTFHDLYEHYPEFHIDISFEKKLLEQHDVIIWHHPIYWYSCPPLMKQWLDLVLEFGWAYGPGGNALSGKICLHVVTTGGSENQYTPHGKHYYSLNVFLRPFEQTAGLCGMQYLPPFAIMGTHRLSQKKLNEYATNYKEIIARLQAGKPLQDLKDCAFQTDISGLKKPE